MPLLVEAYRRAVAPHTAPLHELDVAGFKVWIREFDLWCSSCAVAMDGDVPIGVVLGAKRARQTLVHAVGVHPDHLRRGHGRHMLTSLSSKLAILGPPEIVAEVPTDDARATAFFAACGYEPGARLRDFELPASRVPEAGPAGALAPVTLADLVANDAVSPAAPRPWARDHDALTRRADGLTGLAVVSPDRIEAWVLWRPGEAHRELMAVGGPGASRELLGLLVRHVAAQAATPLVFRRVHEDELPWAWLEAQGFVPGLEFRRYSTTARAA